MSRIAIAIHGGAGTITPDLLTPGKERAYKAGLEEAIRAGYTLLEKGNSALDAVEAAVMALENFPLFNAGRGAVFNHRGKHELDASIMDGATLEAGAVAGVSNVQNPVKLARIIKDHSGHVLLCGHEAEEFAKRMKLPLQPDEYFHTEERHAQWLKVRDTDVYELDHTVEKKFGTVGAVAIDRDGNLAAATSTGGMTNKRFGRIGDTPIIGAGTYANNNTCAVSCTGHGEFFIRAVVAYDVSCLMEYKGMSLKQACDEVVMKKLVKLGGEGGLIAIDRNADIVFSFNSPGMYRGSMKEDGKLYTAIFKTD